MQKSQKKNLLYFCKLAVHFTWAFEVDDKTETEELFPFILAIIIFWCSFSAFVVFLSGGTAAPEVDLEKDVLLLLLLFDGDCAADDDVVIFSPFLLFCAVSD